jgi:hypothetical protein
MPTKPRAASPIAPLFVTGNEIWGPIEERLAAEQPAHIAVPFIGLGAAKWLHLKTGTHLVTRCSVAAARAGQVCGHDLLAWHDAGVKIYDAPTLHAKVYAFADGALVGSSNASNTSREKLDEAGMWVQDPVAVQSARQFVLDRCDVPLTRKQLERLAKEYRPPHQFPLAELGERSFSARTVKAGATEAPLQLVRTYYVEFDEAEEAALTKAESKAEAVLAAKQAPKRSIELQSFAWDMATLKLKVGDMVLVRFTDKKESIDGILPWGRILSVQRVAGSNGSIVVLGQLRKYKPMDVKEFDERTGGAFGAFPRKGGRNRSGTAAQRDLVLKLWPLPKAGSAIA